MNKHEFIIKKWWKESEKKLDMWVKVFEDVAGRKKPKKKQEKEEEEEEETEREELG